VDKIVGITAMPSPQSGADLENAGAKSPTEGQHL